MSTMIPKIEAFKGDYIDIEMNHERTDITGYSITATIRDSNNVSYQKLGLSVDSTEKTSSLEQTYYFKVNGETYSIEAIPDMSYVQISSLMNIALKDSYTCEIVGIDDDQDIKIRNNSIGSEYFVEITAGDTNNLLTLLDTTPSTAKSGTTHTITKNSELAGGSSDQINWIDTRAGYQEFGLSIASTDPSGVLAADYDITVNDDNYTISLTLNETYTSIVSKLNSELGSEYTCSITGTTPTQDIVITHNTLGDDNDVSIEAGTENDLLTILSAPLNTAVVGFTNKGWYNVYVETNETSDFTREASIIIEVTDTDGNKTSKRGFITLKDNAFLF